MSVSENTDWEILGLCDELLWENKEEESDETLPGGFTVIPEYRRMQTESFVEVFGKQCGLK